MTTGRDNKPAPALLTVRVHPRRAGPESKSSGRANIKSTSRRRPRKAGRTGRCSRRWRRISKFPSRASASSAGPRRGSKPSPSSQTVINPACFDQGACRGASLCVLAPHPSTTVRAFPGERGPRRSGRAGTGTAPPLISNASLLATRSGTHMSALSYMTPRLHPPPRGEEGKGEGDVTFFIAFALGRRYGKL